MDGVSVKVGVALAVVGLGLGACEQGDVYSSSAAGSGKSAASSTTGCGSHCGNGAGTSSGGGSTSSTGTTSGSVCSQVTAADPDAGCGSGLVELQGGIYDLCATFESANGEKVPKEGVSISALGCPTPAQTTDSQGLFGICVPPDQNVTTTYAISGYVTGNMAEVNLTQSLDYVGANGGIYMLCNEGETTYGPSLPQWDMTQGTVLAVVTSLSEMGVCHSEEDGGNGVTPDYTGWVFQPQYMDGDAGPWPIVYLDKSGQPDPAATFTSSTGFALVYNVDAGEIRMSVTREPGDPYDIGSLCPVENAAKGFTGAVEIVPAQFGFAPFLVP